MRKAIPTEYRGIRFRSKSEAVFARCLDMAGHEWGYEPAKHAGHVWDFLVFRRMKACKVFECGGERYRSTCQSTWYPSPTLVELKPAMPTFTYIENLTRKMREDPRESVVVWGSPWQGPTRFSPDTPKCSYVCYPVFSSDARYGWGDFIHQADHGDDVPYSNRHQMKDSFGIDEGMVQEAKAYRFDLRRSAG